MKKWILLACALLALLLPLALSQRLAVVRYSISSEKLAGNAVLAVVSDLHNSFFGEAQQQLAAEIRAAQPDAVLITGDAAASMHELDGIRALIQALEGEYPLFYVSGNHEASSGKLYRMKRELRGMGVRVLEGESVLLPCGVRIAGVDDPLALTDQRWAAQIDACRSADESFTMLMSHRPERVDAYREGFDLVVSGHAHGGQVRIPGLLNGLWAPNQGFLPKYAGGMYDLGGGSLIVSRGLTKGGVPRVFIRPELVIVQLAAPDS